MSKTVLLALLFTVLVIQGVFSFRPLRVSSTAILKNSNALPIIHSRTHVLVKTSHMALLIYYITLYINIISPHPHPPHRLYFRYSSVIFPPLIFIITRSEYFRIYYFYHNLYISFHYSIRLLLHMTHDVTYHYIIILCLYYVATKNIRGTFFEFHYLYYIILLYMITIMYI